MNIQFVKILEVAGSIKVEMVLYEILNFCTLEVSCLMERRSLAPYGLLGGGEGARGINYGIKIG